MGIRGLTTFVQNRSDRYMDKYELHDCNLVLDGNSVSSQLYRWHCQSNDCFGGDYDKFGQVIRNFFSLLKECNVTPYIVFDGGYETKKLTTIKERMTNKIKAASQINTINEGSLSVFPLILSLTFKDIVRQLQIKVVQCDFEGDSETACIAKALNCPVLSYDSDYFIYDVQYIPFNDFELISKRECDPKTKKNYNFIPCKLYRVDKFLSSFGGLEKDRLPLLAVLLGNDYVNRGIFYAFYNNLKTEKGHGQNDQQNRIKSVILWLRNESVQSAIKTILGRFKKAQRKNMRRKIIRAINGYSLSDSTFLNYLGIDISIPNAQIGQNLNEEDDNDENENEDEDVDESNLLDVPEPEQEEEVEAEEHLTDTISAIFFERFRKCLLPPCFMDMISLHRYYCISQVEEVNADTSHTICFNIIAAIHHILTNSNDPVFCIGKNKFCQVKKFRVIYNGPPLPNFVTIQNMNLLDRQKLFLTILNVGTDNLRLLSQFPSNWNLILLSLKYWSTQVQISNSSLYAIILNCIVLNFVDTKIGFHRNFRGFMSKFNTKLTAISKQKVEPPPEVFSIKEAIDKLSYNDCLVCMSEFMQYYQMDPKMKSNYKLYERSIVNNFALFQSCLLHLKYLNHLCNFAFEDILPSDAINCTFLYNMSINLKKRQNIDDYMRQLLQKAPTVFNLFQLMIEKVRNVISLAGDVGRKCRKRKRKARNESTGDDDKDEDEAKRSNQKDEDSDDGVVDPNNRFALLCKMDE